MISVDNTSIGSQITGTTGPGPETQSILRPWEFQQGDGANSKKVQCNQYSFLRNPVDQGGVATIASMGDFFSPTAGQYAYVKIDQDATIAITATTLKVDGGWSDMDKEYEVDNSDPSNPFVKTWYILLGKFVDPSDPAPGKTLTVGTDQIKYAQEVFENQRLVPRELAGLIGWSVEAAPGLV